VQGSRSKHSAGAFLGPVIVGLILSLGWGFSPTLRVANIPSSRVAGTPAATVAVLTKRSKVERVQRSGQDIRRLLQSPALV